MKKVSLLILFILCINLSLAYESVFDDYVFNLDTFTVGSDIYYAKLADDDSAVILYKNDFPYHIPYGRCEETKDFRYCFNGTELDYEEYGRHIPGTLVWEPSIRITIESRIPTIEVTRSSESTTSRSGRVFVEILVENTGAFTIRELVYKEPVPPAVISVDAINDEIVFEHPILLPGDSKIFTYYIEPEGYGDIDLNAAELTYTFEGDTYTSNVAAQTITITPPFSLTSKFDKNTVEAGEEFTYTFSITNDDPDDLMKVDFQFYPPDEVEIVKIPIQFLQAGAISRFMKLPPDESETYTFIYKSKYDKDLVFDTYINIEIRDEVYDEGETLTVNSSIPKLVPTVSISSTEVNEGDNFEIDVYVDNDNDINFFDLSGVITSTLIDTQNVKVPIIAESKKVELVDESVTAKKVAVAENHYVRFKGKYRSETNQFFDFDVNKSIKIKPLTLGLDVIPKLDKTEVVQGENITVTVDAKNTGNVFAEVFVYEILPNEFKVISGLTQAEVTLSNGANKKMYSYKLATEDVPAGVYNIDTILNHDDGLIFIKKSNEIVVKEYVEQVVVEVPKIPDTVVERKEEKTFVGKIIDFFVDFFS